MDSLIAVDLNELRSVAELSEHQTAVRTRITELNKEKEGLPFNDSERDEFDKLRSMDSEIGKRIPELEARARYVSQIADENAREHADPETDDKVTRTDAAQGSRKERDLYDLSTVRMDLSRPEVTRAALHDRAKRAIEISRFPLTESREDQRVYGVNTERAKAHVERLLEQDNPEGAFARYILATGSPAYRRAFSKSINSAMRGMHVLTLTGDEERALNAAIAAERALSLTTTGLPVPYQLDPTVIPTSAFSVNPWRAICSVEQVVVNQWRGATSGAITAAYAAEGTEATDNTPTMTQPSIDAVRAQAFVPFSIEVGQDWDALQTTMARLIQDAKDDLESNKFFSGGGTNEPFGLNAATSGIDTAAGGSAAFAAADLYNLEGALNPRFRARASMVANRAQYNRVRQFDTQGGAQLWLYIREALNNAVPTPGNTNASLLGYPAYESSQMLSVLTTGSRIVLLGDFSYYKIIDRVGMSLEVIPHIFGAANRLPIGQRGLYAFWRNGGKLIAEGAFRFLKTS